MHPSKSVLSPTCSWDLETVVRGLSRRSWCSHWAAPAVRRPGFRCLRTVDHQRQWGLKSASTLASSTAINATKEVPVSLRELHGALKTVKERAVNYVSLSRLDLALRSVESENPVVRVAVLGLHDQAAARRLAQVLLVDPLSVELPWESSFGASESEDGRALLLRYGESRGIYTENALLRTLSIPSPILKSHNLEILVASIDTELSASVQTSPTINPSHVALVPRLELRAPAGRQFTTINYPVHKALLYGEGIHGCLALGRCMAAWPKDQLSRTMTRLVFGLDPPHDTAIGEVEDQVTVVDVKLASAAVSRFRESLEHGTSFEHDWFRSGVPRLLEWLTHGLDGRSPSVKPAVRNLIETLLDEASEEIRRADRERKRIGALSTLPEHTAREMKALLVVWAEHAHTELRYELDVALNGERWRRLKWWKLFWRVDDIGMVASEILQRSWLVQAEKDIAWLAGRVEGAGFLRDSSGVGHTAETNLPWVTRSTSEPELDNKTSPPGSLDQTETTLPTKSHGPPPPLRPWPPYISRSRTTLTEETVTSLESLGQALMLQTLTTALLSSALSALVYVSWAGTSVYAASAIAALGISWSMRRLQGKWETTRHFWESEIREEGRKALKDTQETMTAIIDEGCQRKKDSEDIDEHQDARAAVDLARQALSKLR